MLSLLLILALLVSVLRLVTAEAVVQLYRLHGTRSSAVHISAISPKIRASTKY